MSAAIMLSELVTAASIPSLTASGVTTPEYESSPGSDVRCPPATNLAFLRRSNLTSKIMWQGILLYPLGGLLSLGIVNTSNSFILSISFLMACFQASDLASLSNARASLIFLGTLTPNLYLGAFFFFASMTCLVNLMNFLGFLRYLLAHLQ